MLAHTQLLEPLSQLTGCTLHPRDFATVGGGSINNVYSITQEGRKRFCCKVNSASKFPQLFAWEKQGLLQLQPYFPVPEVLGTGECAGLQYLLLEWIEQDRTTPAFWKNFGAALAHMHSIKAPLFGAGHNNYMGAVPQENTASNNWGDFFANRRLMPLARKCAQASLLNTSDLHLLENTLPFISSLFANAVPSLVHGDLWSGNFLCGKNGKPYLIDPAVYYGHPAVDLGMTTMFGGFDPLFYEAYHYHAPLPSQHQEQWAICNLYPLLIHLLLFGAAYLSTIRKTLQRFSGSH